MSKLMRTPEVAEMLGIPESTLRWFRHTGQGPKSFRLGARRVVYLEADVTSWIQEQYDAEHKATA
ncbi:helix-turn-helix transcriptional regulator [Isoptericola rhizosphaerae]|uniref:helix-turn-helix transcriptional regulator n=1 Tax=Isoptericola rhizosphaerae TaxID=3377837 RepID=UPI00383A9322